MLYALFKSDLIVLRMRYSLEVKSYGIPVLLTLSQGEQLLYPHTVRILPTTKPLELAHPFPKNKIGNIIERACVYGIIYGGSHCRNTYLLYGVDLLVGLPYMIGRANCAFGFQKRIHVPSKSSMVVPLSDSLRHHNEHRYCNGYSTPDHNKLNLVVHRTMNPSFL